MLAEVLAIAAVIAVTQIVLWGLDALIQLWGASKEMPEEAFETVHVEMSETDQKMIEETQKLITSHFGDNMTEKMKTLSNKERVMIVSDFAEELVKLYGLDIDVDITVDPQNQIAGAYIDSKRLAVFNIAFLMVNADNQYFEACMRETIDTIVHELRHAVQCKVCREPGFWDVDEERRTQWIQNSLPENYIKPSVDEKGYVSQPVEADAYTYAGLVMNGVN